MRNTLPPNGIIKPKKSDGRLTHEQFLEKASDKFEYLEKYTLSNVPIRCRCLTCGEEYKLMPNKLMSKDRYKNGCTKCSKSKLADSLKLPFSEFEKRVIDLGYVGWSFSEYNGLREPIVGTGPDGVTKRYSSAQAFLSEAFSKSQSRNRSNDEDELFNKVKEMCPDIISGDRTVIPSNRAEGYFKEIDLYSPSLKVGIEYDGLWTHSLEGLARREEKMNHKFTEQELSKYHLYKTNECYKKGVFLVHIFEDEWLDHKDIVLDKIQAVLKVPFENRIFARKTFVHMVDRGEANKFLDDNHIQGKSPQSRFFIGLFYNDELVAIQAFGELRKGLGGTGDKEFELQRYATKLGSHIIGGFSKCLKFFERNYNPSLIVSFADLRWTNQDNNVYLSNGFLEARRNAPGYFYVKHLKRHHRFKFNKKAIKQQFPDIYSDDKTEKQMMREAKYLRVYDCGNIRYEKEYK